MILRRLFLATLFTIASSTMVATAADWPQFRGPNGNGKTEAGDLPTEWSKDKNVRWFFQLPGPGNSSPIVSNGKVFVTCAEEKGKLRHLYCIDRKSGKELWKRTVEWNKPEQMHRTNPYCGSTPAADGERVVVWEGSAGVHCYDFTGKKLWSKDLGLFTHVWGYGSSPIIYKGKVIINAGPGKRQFLVALDLKSGKIVWQEDEPGGSDSNRGRYIGSWSTPVIATIDGKEQLLCSMPTRVVARDPDSGKLIWEIAGIKGPKGDLFYTSPVWNDKIGVVMGGYSGPIVTFRLGGSGNVAEKNILWRSERPQPQRIGSGIIVGDYVYIANADAGSAMCFALKDGTMQWRERFGGGAHWGSMVLVNGLFYVTGKNGTTTIFKPNPEKFELVAKNTLGGPSNSTPAISDGDIILRTSRGVYCVSKSAGK